jgi:hypothetical protein
VKTFNTRLTGWYAPMVGQRFRTPVNSNAVTVHLYTTGLTSKPEAGLSMEPYKLNYMAITLSTQRFTRKTLLSSVGACFRRWAIDGRDQGTCIGLLINADRGSA